MALSEPPAGCLVLTLQPKPHQSACPSHDFSPCALPFQGAHVGCGRNVSPSSFPCLRKRHEVLSFIYLLLEEDISSPSVLTGP